MIKSLIFLSLLFGISLLFSLQGISLLFGAFLPSFPGILGVRGREKILVFLGGFPCFSQKSRKRRSGMRKVIGSAKIPAIENAMILSPAISDQRSKCTKIQLQFVVFKARLGEPFLGILHIIFFISLRQNRHSSPQNRHSRPPNRQLGAQPALTKKKKAARKCRNWHLTKGLGELSCALNNALTNIFP